MSVNYEADIQTARHRDARGVVYTDAVPCVMAHASRTEDGGLSLGVQSLYTWRHVPTLAFVRIPAEDVRSLVWDLVAEAEGLTREDIAELRRVICGALDWAIESGRVRYDTTAWRRALDLLTRGPEVAK